MHHRDLPANLLVRACQLIRNRNRHLQLQMPRRRPSAVNFAMQATIQRTRFQQSLHRAPFHRHRQKQAEKGNGLQRLRSFVIDNGLRVHANLGINAAHAPGNDLLTLITGHQVLERRNKSVAAADPGRLAPSAAWQRHRRQSSAFPHRERTRPVNSARHSSTRRQSTTLQKAAGGGCFQPQSEAVHCCSPFVRPDGGAQKSVAHRAAPKRPKPLVRATG